MQKIVTAFLASALVCFSCGSVIAGDPVSFIESDEPVLVCLERWGETGIEVILHGGLSRKSADNARCGVDFAGKLNFIKESIEEYGLINGQNEEDTVWLFPAEACGNTVVIAWPYRVHEAFTDDSMAVKSGFDKSVLQTGFIAKLCK